MADLGVDPELGHVLVSFYFPIFLSDLSPLNQPPANAELYSQADVHIDNERTATISPPINANDPFGIRNGLVSDTELVGLRKRGKSKAVGKYQSRQNNVCLLLSESVYVSRRANLHT